MSTKIILSDGVEIEASDRKGNRSGYTGAALSPSWTLDGSRPFVAACGNPKDKEIMSQLRAQHRTAWHGGFYTDAREAAYVVSRFRQDPLGTEQELAALGGNWQDFPQDLYDLPVVCSADQAREEIRKSHEDSKIKVVKDSKKKLDLNQVLREVGIALKGIPRDNKFVRESVEAQMPMFRNIQDAVALALDLVQYSGPTKLAKDL